MTRAARVLLLALLGAAITSFASAEESAVIPLPADLRPVLDRLGAGVVGEAIPATPIDEPSRLRHLSAGTWTYRIVGGSHAGQSKQVTVVPVASDGPDSQWRVDSGGKDIATLEVTTRHLVVKLSQEVPESDRLIVYEPGLVLDPGMRAGTSKTVDTAIASYKGAQTDESEHDGRLQYTTRYIGAYRVNVPAGHFDARLLQHRYEMTLGPARIEHMSYGLYVEDVGNVADVSDMKIRAVLLYRSTSSEAMVLLSSTAD